MNAILRNVAQHHALSPADQAAMAAIRPLALPNKGKLRGVAARPMFEAIQARITAATGVNFREETVGGVPGWWCEPADAPAQGVLLHLHGGWFGWGSAAGFRPLVSHLAAATGLRAFVPDYRLAPEHPFPAATQDVARCYRALQEQGAGPIVVGGDSAGGNLALSLLAFVAGHGDLRAPACAYALSPVTDLTQSGASWANRAEADPYFVFEQASAMIAAYLNGHDAADPQASPLFADLAQLPPVRIHVGDDEMLLDDSVRFAERATEAGSDVRVDIWQGMPHGFVGGQFEAAGLALKEIGAFVKARLATV